MRIKNLIISLAALLNSSITFANLSQDKSNIPYQNCSDELSKKLNHTLNYTYNFKNKEKDCLVINNDQALMAVALPIEQNSSDTPYLLRIYLIDYKKFKILNQLEKDELLDSSYEDFDGIHFDLVHFSSLKDKHIIALRHNWSRFLTQTNSANEYLELIEIQHNQKLRFVLNDLPMTSHYFSRSECPSNQATWGASINSILILDNQQQHGLQNLILKQHYVHNEAHQETGCKAIKQSQKFQITLPFDGEKYQYSIDDLMQIDVI